MIPMLDLLQYAMLVTAVGWIVATVVGWLDQTFYPPLPGRRDDRQGFSTEEDAPTVSILIPARNEERNIEGCVLSVLNQTYPHLNVIVVNDQSTDQTGELLDEMAANDERLSVVHGQELPDGWIGKGWALYQGYQEASGKWIVLLDADVRLEPWAVERVVEHAERKRVDFLNPFPRFVCISFWERLMQPLLWGLVRLRYPLVWVNQQWARENMAFGPMIVVRRSAYDTIDGHKLVASDILEDVALAKLMRRRGYRTFVVNGKRLLRVRMYHNLRELIDGWTKTAYGAMNYNFALMILAIGGLFWAALQPFITVAYGVTVADETWVYLGGFQILGIAFRRLGDARENDFPLWSILLHPFALLVVHYMQLSALWQYYFGSYHWKGRLYHRPQPAHHAETTEDTATK